MGTITWQVCKSPQSADRSHLSRICARITLHSRGKRGKHYGCPLTCFVGRSMRDASGLLVASKTFSPVRRLHIGDQKKGPGQSYRSNKPMCIRFLFIPRKRKVETMFGKRDVGRSVVLSRRKCGDETEEKCYAPFHGCKRLSSPTPAPGARVAFASRVTGAQCAR